MSALLVSHRLYIERQTHLAPHAAAAKLEVIALPQGPEARLGEDLLARVTVALFSGDMVPDHSRQFFSAVRKAPNLEWLHVFNVGVDHPVYTEMLERGVRLTTSTGTMTEAIAQTAIAGLLMLARPFKQWLAGQAERRWEPIRTNLPRDLRGQTALVLGLGDIGREIARLARALGLHVIGVKRSARAADDPVDELYP